MIWNSFITVVLISTRQRDCFLLPESLTLWAPRHSLTLPSPLPVAGHHSQHFPTGPNHSFFMVFTLEISPRQTRCTWTPRGSCHCSTEITLVLSVAVGYVRCLVFGFVSCRDDCCASSLWRELNSSFLSSKSKIIRKISWFHPTDSVDSAQCPSGQ